MSPWMVFAAAFHNFPDAEHLRRGLLYVWLVYKAADVICRVDPSRLADIPVCLDERLVDLRNTCFTTLADVLRSAFLEFYASQHRCQTCVSMPVVAVDGKVNHAVRVCRHRGNERNVPLPAMGIQLRYGCLERVCDPRVTCKNHGSIVHAARARIQCHFGHALRPVAILPGWDYSCDMCSAAIEAGSTTWRCLHFCDYDMCDTCHSCAQRAAASAPEPFSRSGSAAAATSSAEDSAGPADGWSELEGSTENPCGISKVEAAHITRWHGSSLACTLSCGTVAFVLPIAGHESFTQVYGMIAEIATRRKVTHVVYDNACVLKRFARNVMTRHPTETSHLLSLSVHYCLDRWHAVNHTACLDHRHRLYTPGITLDEHPELSSFDSSRSEQLNAWLELFVGMTRHMSASTYDVFLFLLLSLWNDHIVGRATDVSVAPPAPSSAVRDLLKRRRH